MNTTLTVTGTGFTSSTAIQVAGVLEATTYVSSTQVSSVVPASQLTNGSLLNVVAYNGTLSSGSGTAIHLEVDNPVPAITQFVPVTFTTATPGAILTVVGTGFVPSTVLQINGSARSTAYVSSTQVTAVLTVADLGSVGSLTLTAANPAPGGGTSPAASLPVNNGAPGAISLSPSTLITGATTPTTITVNGSGFLPSSVVQVGAVAHATTFLSGTQLTFQLSVAEQATAGRDAISVVTPAPGGGTSPIASLTLTAPTPTPVLSQVSPTQFTAGSGITSIYVYGTGLTTSSVVQWNGTALVTANGFGQYGNELIGTVPASLVATAGTASITVSNPTAPVPLSNALPVTIVNPPAPTLTSLSLAAVPINQAAMLSLYGTGFTASSTVTFNGAAIAATYVSSTNLTVTIPAASLNLLGNDSLAVTTPAPGGGTTVPLTLTAYLPIVNNSMIYNPVNGLFYLSIPSTAGAPYANSIVSVDPSTGNFGTPIFVGSEPNKMALTSDGEYLWVGLDGASAVRKVDLNAGTAGLQFSLGNISGIYNTPPTAVALAALPGATNSVVVSAGTYYSYSGGLRIYDSGVARGTQTTSNNSVPNALQVDGTRNEVYAAGSGFYNTYTYSASGLTAKASVSTGSFASSSFDEIQIAGGRLYTDFGTVDDAESGSLLGTFYNNMTTAANGPVTVDTTLNKAFILDMASATYYSGTYNQIEIFDTTSFNQSAGGVIPVSLASVSVYANSAASRLSRWGTNGLAFRTPYGFHSLRSNLVKDLSSTNADLGVTLTSAGSNTSGTNTTYTATVTNAGPSASTNIVLTAQIPSSAIPVSATASAGSCSLTTSVTCSLGGLANGASATVTVVVTPTTPGSASFSAQVTGSETDPTLTNNKATLTLTIGGSVYNLVPAITSISPAAIQAGASDTTVTVNGIGGPERWDIGPALLVEPFHPDTAFRSNPVEALY